MERRPTVTCLLGAALALAASLTPPSTDPRPPRLIDCVFVHRANVTCRWEPGDAAVTRYTLQVQRIPGINRLNTSLKIAPTTFSCSTSGTSCTAPLNRSSASFEFCVSVTAHGARGDDTSERRCQSGRLEVMLPAVTLSAVKEVKGRPRCLNVTWSVALADFTVSLPEIRAGNLTSQISFTAGGQSDPQVCDVTVRDRSFLVCVFRPDSSYGVQLRHRLVGAASSWSPWSNEARGTTAEDAPSAAPDFWRRVKHTDVHGWRLSSLLWQPLPRSQANGRVLFYNVTCETAGGRTLEDHGNCTGLDPTHTSCSLLLPAARCSCSLTASTSGGTSPEAHLWLLGASEAEPPPPHDLSVTPLDDSRLDVGWTAAADWSPSGFVVEWFPVRGGNDGVLRWRRLNGSCTALVISEGVKPLERFAVSVRALYGEKGAGQNTTTFVYTRQGAPSAGPTVRVEQHDGSTVTLTWTPVPVEQLHGFITSYTLFYTSETGESGSESLSKDFDSFPLDLPPGVYVIYMRANTEAGAGAAGPEVTVTLGPASVSVVLWILLPLILSSLGLVTVACLAQTKLVKEKFFQVVPDPSHSSLAHWTPKPVLEACSDKVELKYSEVVLLSDCDQIRESSNQSAACHLQPSYQSVACHLQPYSLCSPLPASDVLALQTRPETKNWTRTSSDGAVYSDVLLQKLSPPPPPLPPLPRRQSGDGVEGDKPLNASPGSGSPLSQSSGSSSTSLSSSSSSSSPPHQLFLKEVHSSAPSLQTRPDNLCGAMMLLPFPGSVFVEMNYCPVSCDSYVSPAV